MTLVAVAAPENESDIAVIQCVLEANDIPCFVQGAGFGGLFPGPRIHGYNSRRVLVPAAFVEQAAALIAEFDFGVIPPPAPGAPPPPSRSRVAMLLEFIFMGWFVPNRPAPQPEDEDEREA